MKNPSARALSTRLVHAGERVDLSSARPTATPIYTSSTFVHPRLEDLDRAFESGEGFVYSRHGNPTAAQLEAAMASVEDGEGSVAFASGMGALYAAVLAAATPRGETKPSVRGVVASRDLYGATVQMLDSLFGVTEVDARATNDSLPRIEYVDACDGAAVEAALQRTGANVLIVEQISNPLLRVVDVSDLAERAHRHQARLVVDNTFATPLLERPLARGADVSVHSATKFLGGHADVTAGVATARTQMVLASLRRYAKLTGGVLGPFEASLVARGIKTLALRVAAQCDNASDLAGWLARQPAVARVYYPGLPEHPQHRLASERFDGKYGALVSFELKVTERERMFAFMDALELIVPATSLGDVYTLATLPMVSSHRDLGPEQRRVLGISDALVRLSVGIEDADDLKNDLSRALQAVVA